MGLTLAGTVAEICRSKATRGCRRHVSRRPVRYTRALWRVARHARTAPPGELARRDISMPWISPT
jgi:hypothetical protein